MRSKTHRVSSLSSCPALSLTCDPCHTLCMRGFPFSPVPWQEWAFMTSPQPSVFAICGLWFAIASTRHQICHKGQEDFLIFLVTVLSAEFHCIISNLHILDNYITDALSLLLFSFCIYGASDSGGEFVTCQILTNLDHSSQHGFVSLICPPKLVPQSYIS